MITGANVADYIVDEYNPNQVGTQNLTVKVTDTWTYPLTVIVENSVKSIAVTTLPENTDLEYGTSLQGGKITVTMADDTTTTKNFSDDGVEVNYSNTTIGANQEVTVTYEGQTDKFNIDVFDVVTSVAIKPGDELKTEYRYNDPFDSNGARLLVYKKSNPTEPEEVNITSEMIPDFKTDSVGPKTVTITFTSSDSLLRAEGTACTTPYNYIVNDYVTGIALSQTSILGEVGQSLDLSGINVNVTMASGTPTQIVLVDGIAAGTVTISEYDNSTPGIKHLTVTYGGETATLDVDVKDRITSVDFNVDSINESHIQYGQELDLSQVTATVHYAGSSDEVIQITKNMIQGYDKYTLGMQDLTITVLENYTQPVTVYVDDYVIGVTLTDPTTTQYVYGTTTLDLTGGYLTESMASGSARMIYLTETDKVTVTGYDLTPDELGNQTIDVIYNGEAYHFVITVIDEVRNVVFNVDSIAANDYRYGDSLNLDGATATVSYASPREDIINIDGNMISGYVPTTIGEQEITITVLDNYNTTLTVNVVNYIKSIAVTAPTQTVVKYNNDLNLTGGSVLITMADNSVEGPKALDAEGVTISGFDKTVLGNQIVTVQVGDKTATFTVKVVDAVDGIEMASLPTKTSYNYGENLDVTGAKITVKKLVGADEEINVTNDMVSGYNPNQLGSQTVTVTYIDGEEEKTTTFSVTVHDFVANTEFTQPTKTSYGRVRMRRSQP